MHIAFGIGLRPGGVEDALETLLDEGYYESLAPEADPYSAYPDEKQSAYIRRAALGVYEHAAELDEYIEKYAKNWRVARISRVAVAVLRLAMFEVLYMPEIPDAAAINEAVELMKKYEDQETVSFVNGILGSFIRGETDFPAP